MPSQSSGASAGRWGRRRIGITRALLSVDHADVDKLRAILGAQRTGALDTLATTASNAMAVLNQEEATGGARAAGRAARHNPRAQTMENAR